MFVKRYPNNAINIIIDDLKTVTGFMKTVPIFTVGISRNTILNYSICCPLMFDSSHVRLAPEVDQSYS